MSDDDLASQLETDKPDLDSSRFSRRSLLKRLGAITAATPLVASLESLGVTPHRPIRTAHTNYPDIQFDIGNFCPPARPIDDIPMLLPPVYTIFLTAKLNRAGAPTTRDQSVLSEALHTIESSYPFEPRGVFLHISYGVPYFRRLPLALVAGNLPVFLATGDAVLKDSVPAPTDVHANNPHVTKKNFNVAVQFEDNDLLITLRSDILSNLTDIVRWLRGSNQLRGRATKSPQWAGLLRITSERLMFAQIGMPRKVADQHNLPYASRVNPRSPMWMGFFSQQSNGFGPPTIATFQGNDSARFTGMRSGTSIRPVTASDYFYNGSIQVLSHDILDLEQWYADDQPYVRRAGLMFRANPCPHAGYSDQFGNGGGPAALPNHVVLNRSDGTTDALLGAKDTKRLGHLQALQRATRAPDGTIVPQRVDGPGFDAMDVPDGSPQPKLQFSVFLPSAQNFEKARMMAAGGDLCPLYAPDNENGIEPFMTATRRQNFLCPPRSHRAFPLLELA